MLRKYRLVYAVGVNCDNVCIAQVAKIGTLQRGKWVLKVTLPGLMLAAVVILVACSAVSMEDPPLKTDSLQVDAGEPSESTESDEGANAQAPPTKAPTYSQDFIVISHLPGNVLAQLNTSESNPVRGWSSCRQAVSTAKYIAGSAVELSIGSGLPPVIARLEASPANGEILPCTMEARFSAVPVGATEFRAKQVGGKSSITQTASFKESAAERDDFRLVLETSGKTYPIKKILNTSCLSAHLKSFRIEKNFNEFLGPSLGQDIAIEQRVTLRNRCGQRIKAVAFTSVFSDLFEEGFSACSARLRINLAHGKSMTTPPGNGCIVYQGANSYSNWQAAQKRDISYQVIVTDVVLDDGTKLDKPEP